mgnify:CR=1 FL=1
MKTKAIAIVAMLLCVTAFVVAQAKPELKIEYRFNVTGPDAGNFFYFTGPSRYMDSGQTRYTGTDGKDGLGNPDATSHASKYHSTEIFNHYQYDIFGNTVIPGGLRGLFLFPVATGLQAVIDGLKVAKLADGSIQIRYVHRGTAYEIVTEKNGTIDMAKAFVTQRVIGHTDNVIHTDFSATGKVGDVDWTKVWNASIADGKQVGSTTAKTGKIVKDSASPNAIFGYAGLLQFTFDGKILGIAGTLTIVKK